MKIFGDEQEKDTVKDITKDFYKDVITRTPDKMIAFIKEK